ncbi:MAG: hypothetical protein WBA85_04140, partial [Brucella anthropi]
GIPAALSLKPGKFQLSVAQNRGAPHKTAGANSKLDKTWGQGHRLSYQKPPSPFRELTILSKSACHQFDFIYSFLNY